MPVVVACPGHAVAAGALLMLGADDRIGARGAFRIGLIETQIGMVLPRWAVELARGAPVGRHFQQATVGARMYSARTGQARLGYRPSKKSIKRMVETIHALTARTGTSAGDQRTGGQVKSHLTWMGELLPSRNRHQSVSCDRQLHRCAVAPVVAHQAQSRA